MFSERKYRRYIIVSITFFSIIVLIIGTIAYQEEKQKQISFKDKFLHTIAIASNNLLQGNNLHADLEPSTISRQEELDISKRLKVFAQQMDIAYVYSMIQDKENKIRFITSNPEPHELENGNYEYMYWTTYPEAAPEVFDAFNSMQTTYAQYSDRWGTFRSIFYPLKAVDGTTYVIGVDIPVSDVNSLAQKSMVSALAKTILVAALILPFMYVGFRTLYQNWKIREVMYYTDDTTNLPNKNALDRDLRATKSPHLLLINIDRFREVSSAYSLAFGDKILREFGNNLKRFHDPCLTLLQAYRVHSDEFAVLAEHSLDFQDRKKLFYDFYSFITKCRYRLPDNRQITLGVHVGIADGVKKETYALAEMALRLAQDTNRSVVLYDEVSTLPSQYKKNLEETELVKRAIYEDRFTPYYHPMVNSTTGKIEKYEVLARMIDQHGNIIMMPDTFIPILQRIRLYNKFTLNLLNKVLKEINDNNTHVSFNISTRDITDEITFGRLLKAIHKSGKAGQLHFEILETDSLITLDELSAAILKLKQSGCRVGLDDLGREYSNFDRLTSLPIDFVKLDRSVMPNILHNSDTVKIVENIIEFANKKKVSTVAEYCSTPELCKFASNLGIDFLQGFWLAKPQRYFSSLENALEN